ncbi:MAG: HAMP domain-containing sensor histidine kinase [Ferruginibacter sp.]
MASLLLLNRFKTALLFSFDEQIDARARLVAEKTNINPRIVPLPQGAETFTVLYVVNSITDTLFASPVLAFVYPLANNMIETSAGWRSIHISRSLENGGTIEIIYSLPSNTIDSKIKDITLLIWLVVPLGFLLAFVIAWWLSSKLLKPVRQVIKLANSINLNNTELLTEPNANDELKELIVSFNRMLLRIKEQSERQTAFFASASHELRTPLSVMQTKLQVLLHEDNEHGPLKELYNDQLKEVKQLNKMVDDFLLMSELRVGKIDLHITTVNVPDFILDLATKYKDKAAGKAIQFKISYQPVNENYELQADEEKLFIIVSNLLDNAVKYSPTRSVVDICLAKTNEGIVFSFSNQVRDDIHPEITDIKNQFYHSKPIHGEGFGLGLWIANQLAIIQGMNLYCSVKNDRQFTATLACDRIIV